MEGIWVEIKTDNINFILSAIYRHPNVKVHDFAKDPKKGLFKLKVAQTCIMVWDINIDFHEV